jgi:hypothetical protein
MKSTSFINMLPNSKANFANGSCERVINYDENLNMKSDRLVLFSPNLSRVFSAILSAGYETVPKKPNDKNSEKEVKPRVNDDGMKY